MLPSSHISLQQIADEARVSRSTVSLALRNHYSIPTETKNRILKISKKLGYRPNPTISMLMSQLKQFRKSTPSSTIAFITTQKSETSWLQNVLKVIFKGASERAYQLGYNLERFCYDSPHMSGKRLTKILHTRNIQGMIVAPLYRPKGHLSMEWPLFAGVIIGYSLASPKLHRVSKDDYLNMLLALRKLRRLGYRKIGLVLSLNVHHRVDLRYSAAYLAYHQLVKIKSIPPLLPELLTQKGFTNWYHKYTPEVILSSENRVPAWLKELNIKVPEQVGIVHLERSHENDHISGIDTNDLMVGAAAVEQVESQLHQNELGIPLQPKLLLIQGKWCDGKTVRSSKK